MLSALKLWGMVLFKVRGLRRQGHPCRTSHLLSVIKAIRSCGLCSLLSTNVLRKPGISRGRGTASRPAGRRHAARAACGGEAASGTARLQTQGHGHGLAHVWHLGGELQRSANAASGGGGGQAGADGTIRGEAARPPAPRGASPPPQRHFRKTTLCPGASSAGAKIMKKPYIPPNYCGLQLGINPAVPRSPQPLPAGFSPPLL